MFIGDILRLHALNYPNKLALVDESGARLTWREFNERVNRLANSLAGMGLAKGERVAIIARNCHQFAEFLFAVAKVGLVSVPLNYRLTGNQVLSIIRDSEPKALLIQEEFSSLINSIRSELSGVQSFIGIGTGHNYSIDYETLLGQNSSEEPKIKVQEDDMWALAYTSGTTGEPKGVPYTHRRWTSGLWINTFVRMRFDLDDIFLLGFPMYMISGLFHLLTACLASATVIIHTFAAESFAELIEKEKVTITYLGVTQYAIVREYLDNCGRNYDFSSLRSVQVGSRPMPTFQLKEMLDFFGIPYHNTHREYGATETVPLAVASLAGEDIARGLRPEASEKELSRVDSVGKPYLVEVRIVDENGNDVAPGEMGEIIFKGAFTDTGYWRKPELSKERFRDGWFYTSDFGVFDEDGYLYLRGRKDFMIKSGQLYVAPLEVENAILKHPAVGEVAVIDVPDEKWGEAVKALVCLKKGQHATEEEMREHCRKYLAGFQVPKSVDFLEALPKDPQGKTNVKELRRIYAQKQH